MPILPADPILTVQNLLSSGWNSANTSSVTPKFHTGWFNENWKTPQVTVTDFNDFPTGGGVTGFRAIDSLGNGVKLMLGQMNVGVWSHRDDDSTVNPKQLIFEMSEEVKRIIKNNLFPNIVTTGLNWLSWTGRRIIVDTQGEPTIFRYDNTVLCMYDDRV